MGFSPRAVAIGAVWIGRGIMSNMGAGLRFVFSSSEPRAVLSDQQVVQPPIQTGGRRTYLVYLPLCNLTQSSAAHRRIDAQRLRRAYNGLI
jgi:hypothetical protein